jgi:hypothetical protein
VGFKPAEIAGIRRFAQERPGIVRRLTEGFSPSPISVKVADNGGD